MLIADFAEVLFIDNDQSRKIFELLFCDLEPLVDFGLFEIAKGVDLILPQG